MKLRQFVYLPLLFLCGACSLFSSKTDHFGSYPVGYNQLEGWNNDAHAQALSTFLQSCPILAKKSRKASSGSGIAVSSPLWQSLCNDAMSIAPTDNNGAKQFFERRFTPYRVTNNDKETGLFTGYYEPILYGSYKKHGDYKYPLYLPPPDLQSRRPYYTHAQINKGVLKNRGLELLYVDDPVMIFFLQIQGSGRVMLDNGKQILVGYAGQNGYPYESIGKIAGDENLIPKDQINFFSLRQWLYDHPQQAFWLMERNPSYVFFKKLDRTGPVGAVGAVLTPQRSIAIDSSYIPYGLPVFMETQLPTGPSMPDPNFDRLMIAQDTGGAIKGPVRADIFFGGGSNAEYLAGYMKGRGKYSLLVPKEITSQLE